MQVFRGVVPTRARSDILAAEPECDLSRGTGTFAGGSQRTHLWLGRICLPAG